MNRKLRHISSTVCSCWRLLCSEKNWINRVLLRSYLNEWSFRVEEWYFDLLAKSHDFTLNLFLKKRVTDSIAWWWADEIESVPSWHSNCTHFFTIQIKFDWWEFMVRVTGSAFKKNAIQENESLNVIKLNIHLHSSSCQHFDICIAHSSAFHFPRLSVQRSRFYPFFPIRK